MFNRNGNNNGNGNESANGVRKDTAVASRNGNGHKPDAAIVSEHELLWDGLSPAVTSALSRPSTPRWSPSARGAAAGPSTTSKATPSSTRRIGYSDTGAGAASVIGDVTLRQIETVDPQDRRVKVTSGYSARCGSPWRALCPAPTSASTR